MVATLSEPAGVKALHWNWEAVENIIGKDFETARLNHSLAFFKEDWQSFLLEGEKEKARRN